MLRSLTLIRGIHISSTNWSSTKTQLLKLRKKTGYPFDSCKKALQLNNNSLEKVKLINLYILISIVLLIVNIFLNSQRHG